MLKRQATALKYWRRDSNERLVEFFRRRAALSIFSDQIIRGKCGCLVMGGERAWGTGGYFEPNLSGPFLHLGCKVVWRTRMRIKHVSAAHSDNNHDDDEE